ncbi:hypothetical protein SNEBB_000302 [Seison nebaliae]|nr:hypothetical protein SNEBB_000302 [Seison nebaliae]
MTNFSVADYVVFSIILLISAAIGIFYIVKGRKEQITTKKMLLGGGDMSVFPVSMSLLASFTSAIAILGFSQEVYSNGTMYMYTIICYVICCPVVAHLWLPLIRNLDLVSAYEYFGHRFDYKTRVLASSVFVIQMFFYMGVVMYTPALAINQVTGIPLWVSIFATGLICTLYTSFGGMKAVMWTDSFQIFIIFAGLLAIVIQGIISVGGVKEVFRLSNIVGRIDFNEFDFTPFKRHTFWTIVFGNTLNTFTVYASNQAMLQRYFSLPTTRAAQKAVYTTFIMASCFFTLTCFCGLIAASKYANCDPLLKHEISKIDQLLPYMVMDLLGKFNGLPGLFVACIYSASLSTVSSGLNSLAAVVLKDFIQPIYIHVKHNTLNEVISTRLTTILGIVFGLLQIAMAFLCQYLPKSILQLTLSIFGMLGGPLLACFVGGFFIPVIEGNGAFCGLLISSIINLTVSILSVTSTNTTTVPKPVSIDNCTDFHNITRMATYRITTDKTSAHDLIGSLSYLYLTPLAMIIFLLVAVPISYLIRKNYDDYSRKDDQLYYKFDKNRTIKTSESTVGLLNTKSSVRLLNISTINAPALEFNELDKTNY